MRLRITIDNNLVGDYPEITVNTLDNKVKIFKNHLIEDFKEFKAEWYNEKQIKTK